MRSIFVITITVFLVFVQMKHVHSYRSKAKIPSISDTEASQWLSTRYAPRRWSQQYLINQPLDEINQSLNQLQLINDNGIRQYDTQSFDGIPMEVLYELSRQSRSLNKS